MAEIKFESYEVDIAYVYGMWAQTFIATPGHNVTKVKLKLYRTTATGTYTVELRTTTSGGVPTAVVLASIGPFNISDLTTSAGGAIYEFALAHGFLVAGTKYAIVINNGGVSNMFWRRAGGYSGGQMYIYASGNWIGSSPYTTYDGYFDVWGDCSLETDAADGIETNAADGNATLIDAADIDEYGFDYGKVSGTYTGEATAVGTPGLTYSVPMTGLDDATVYYFRAKIHHAIHGWLYGNELYFQTLHDDSLILWEYQNTVETNVWGGALYMFQTFSPGSHQIRSVKAKLYFDSQPTSGLITVSIRVTAGGLPTGGDLCTATMPAVMLSTSATVKEFGFGDGILLSAGIVYAIVIYNPTGAALRWKRSASSVYAGGAGGSGNGTSWSAYSWDMWFEEYGETGVITEPPTNVKAISATGNGYINTAPSVTQIGFEWGTTSGGPYPEEVLDTPASIETGIYSLQLTSLAASTTYYYRAKIYSTTYGWLYGNEVEFTTNPPWPEVRTDPPSAVTLTTITAEGYIVDVGAEDADERGFVYGLTSKADPGNSAPGASGYSGQKTEQGTYIAGAFSLLIENLNSGKTHYVRAYAHNSYGYQYGSELKVLCSDTVNVLYPVADSPVGIRFDTSPGGGYPHPYGGTVPHYQLVRTKNTAFVYPYGFWGYFDPRGFVYEKNYYNDNFYTDLYGLSNPVRRTEDVIKVKWKARLYRSAYPYGEYKRELTTHSTQYSSAAFDISAPQAGVGMDVCEIFYTNPNTGIAWTLAELDALQAGVSLGYSGGFGVAACDFLEVIALWANALARTDHSSLFTGSTCRLNGYVMEDEGDACIVYFEYGETTAYGSVTADQTKSRNSVFSADVSGLDSSKEYHYRAVIETPCGETFYGSDMIMEEEYGSLILEQAYSVASVRQPIFTEEPVWTDITEYCMRLHTKRGRLHEFDRVEAGIASFQLNNATGNFWRYNTAGDYYPDIQPLTLTRLRYRYLGVLYPLWYGVSEAYRPGWASDQEGGATPIIDMDCVDLFKSFNRYKLTAADIQLTEKASTGVSHVHLDNVDFLHEGQSVKLYQDEVSETLIISQITPSLKLVIFTTNVVNSYTAKAKLKKFPAVLSGQRITDCLLEFGWPAALSDIDAGQNYVIEHTPPAEGTNIMEHMFAVTESEDGLLFTAADGHVVFQDSIARTKSPYNTSQATFNDDDTAHKYAHPTLVDDDTFIYNEVDILGTGIAPQQVVVGDAAGEQGPRALTRKDSQLYFSSDAFVQAFSLASRYQSSILRCESLLLKPQADPSNLYPLALGSEISTRITFNLNTTANPALISRDYHVEGVEHDWAGIDGLWTTKWQLWMVNLYRAFDVLHDGYFRNYSDGGTYLEMQEAAEANYVENDGSNHNPYTDPNEIVVGQQLYFSILGFNGSLWRGFLEFDTSDLGAGDTVAAGFVLMHVKESFIDDRPWNLVIVDPDTLENPLVVADYHVLLASTTQLGAETMSREGLWIMVPLNATGLTYVNKGGVTRLALRSNWDIAASDNDEEDGYTNEYARLDGIYTDYPPRLIVQLAA